MYSNRRTISLPMHEASTNATQGKYSPKFFDLADYHVKEVNINSYFYNEADVERELLTGNHSFYYLREDKLRTIDVKTNTGELLVFNHFLKHFGISIRSNNLFKTGKYLSRIFRPVKYGMFFNELDIHFNNDPVYSGKVTDGLSLISLDLAKQLGWKGAAANASAQFTLFFDKGLVKGHCVVSDKIEHDVVIYGSDNIKSEISLKPGIIYAAVEPVKLGKTLRMDIQSMLNLWQLFGAEQYLEWAYDGINQFQEDLFSGKLSNWLDDFEEISRKEYDKEQWTLHRAIWRQIDYTRYPGLVRIAWRMFRQSMIRFAEKKNGNPSFRIPVPEGRRGYLRVDLRDHDRNGNFTSRLQRGEVCLDRLGNIWIHPLDTEEFLEIKGGADMDDSAAVIPVKDNKAVIYRNPNQYGEYGIHKIIYDGIEVKKENKLIGIIPYKKIERTVKDVNKKKSSGNNLLDTFLHKHVKEDFQYLEYKIGNLLRTYTKISQNSANIGIAANAEMLKSVVGITSQKMFNKLNKDFYWNLERIIDATVKEGIDAAEDMKKVRELINYLVDNKIEMPKSIVHRFPEKLQPEVKQSKKHQLDYLFEAIKYLIEEADIEVLGKGTFSKWNRIPGRIDRVNVPVQEIGMSNLDNIMHDLSIGLLKDYNRNIAMMLDKTKDLPILEQEELRKAEIERIQKELLESLNSFTQEERKLLSKSLAYNIYKSERFIHDSILWIGRMDELRGTAEDTIDMLADIGIAYQIKKNGTVERFKEIRNAKVESFPIRIWSKDAVDIDKYKSVGEIVVENRDVLVGSDIFNLGEEISIDNGIYNVKRSVISISRRTNTKLKNSLTLYLDS